MTLYKLAYLDIENMSCEIESTPPLVTLSCDVSLLCRQLTNIMLLHSSPFCSIRFYSILLFHSILFYVALICHYYLMPLFHMLYYIINRPSSLPHPTPPHRHHPYYSLYSIQIWCTVTRCHWALTTAEWTASCPYGRNSTERPGRIKRTTPYRGSYSLYSNPLFTYAPMSMILIILNECFKLRISILAEAMHLSSLFINSI